MPLFGKFWSEAETAKAIREHLIFLEMPQLPEVLRQTYKNAGRAAALALARTMPSGLDGLFNVLRMTIELCDRYVQGRRMPYLARTDGRGGVKADSLLDAARYECVWRHYRYLAAAAFDVVLAKAADDLRLAPEVTGEAGSPRWERAKLRLTFAGMKAAERVSMTSFVQLTLATGGFLYYLSRETLPGDRSPIRDEFTTDLSGSSIAQPYLCECGCCDV